MLVDNEHQCQLFYRSLPLPRLLSFAFPRPSREYVPADTKGHGSFDPWPLRFQSPRAVPRPWHPLSVYVADAPGRVGSTSRISPRSRTRDVMRITTRSIRGDTDPVKRPGARLGVAEMPARARGLPRRPGGRASPAVRRRYCDARSPGRCAGGLDASESVDPGC